MRKLNLVAMSYDQDALLDALQRTNAVELTEPQPLEHTVVPEADTEALRAYFASVETALSILGLQVENYEKDHKIRSDVLKDGFDVSYSEFMSAGDRKEEMDLLIAQINRLADEKNALKTELAKLQKQRAEALIYAPVQCSLSAFSDTLHTRVRLGTVSSNLREGASAALTQQELCIFEILNANTDNTLFYVASHRSVAAETDNLLSSFGFVDCPYKDERSGVEIYRELCEKEKGIRQALLQNEHTMYALKDKIRPLKVYCDFLLFIIEKEESVGKMSTTERTFCLQAYLPEYAEENVKAEIEATTNVAYMEFSDPTDEDTPPTLLRNNSIVSNFESITNTYSAPHYREFDPNAVMSFFYSLFMGFIIGDAGYGLLMLLGGGVLWWKNRARPTGMSRLAGAFAVGGIFAVFWGALFNSFFGLALLHMTIMPNPQTDMWSLAGIAVPSVLIIAMLIGVFQLFVGYVCKAVQEWRRGGIVDGICDGVIWALFSVGVGLAIVGFVEEAGLPMLGTIGCITAGVTLLFAMLTAGRKEKFFGKFTKGFGAAYGVINYASDILSYARLYGLMLSGAVIAQIIAQYSSQFLMSGNVLLIALAVVLLVIGHGFNLVMNLLGAYIHDARLQYVEFYGRFYEGDGELFKPLGTEHRYVYLLPAEQTEKIK